MKIQHNSRQIPDTDIYTADKKYCDLLYGVLQEMSYLENDNRYVNKKEINFTSLSKRVNLTRQTTSTKFKNLEKLGLIVFIEEENRYRLDYLDKSLCSLVPLKTLKLMNDSLSHFSISLFVYFLKRYIANGEKEYIVTMSQMKGFIGISTSTTSNNDVINNILLVLKKLGLVDYELRQVENDKTQIYVTKVRNTIQ